MNTSTERTNANRVESARLSFAHYDSGDPDDEPTSIGDLMADLLHLHYAKTNDWQETEAMHARIWRHFSAETDEERS